jgi:hypothetical protein
MTKQTNYVATVTDANSVFPPKGEAIPNSNRGLITATAGQTQGSVGAKDSWFIDLNAQPLASYPNNRLPRWQDLIPLSCDFTSSMRQIPAASNLAYNQYINLQLVHSASSGSAAFNQTLQTVRDVNLRAILTPYYNNDTVTYNQHVNTYNRLTDTRPIANFNEFSYVSGSTYQVCTIIFPILAPAEYCGTGYAGYTNVVNDQFVPTAPVWPAYGYDSNLYRDNISYDPRWVRGATVVLSSSNVNSQFWQAVYNGTGSYSGYMGFSMNPNQGFINNVPTNISANALTDLIIQALKLVGYTF